MLWMAHCRIPSQAPCGTDPPASLPWPGPLLPAARRRAGGSHQSRGPRRWALPVRCAPPRSYLTQERVELVPAQRWLAAGANTLCLRGETRPGSFPARPRPRPGLCPAAAQPQPQLVAPVAELHHSGWWEGVPEPPSPATAASRRGCLLCYPPWLPVAGGLRPPRCSPGCLRLGSPRRTGRATAPCNPRGDADRRHRPPSGGGSKAGVWGTEGGLTPGPRQAEGTVGVQGIG